MKLGAAFAPFYRLVGSFQVNSAVGIDCENRALGLDGGFLGISSGVCYQ